MLTELLPCLTCQWDHPSKIVKMGFTLNESLVVLARDGTYRIFPIASSSNSTASTSSSASSTAVIAKAAGQAGSVTYSQHSLAHDVQDSSILDASILENGMIVLLSSHQFLEVRGWPEPDALAETSVSTSFIASRAPNTRARANGSSDGPTTPHSTSRHGKGRVERFVDSALSQSPSAWCVLTPDQSTSRQTEVLLSSGEALISIDQLDLQDQVCPMFLLR